MLVMQSMLCTCQDSGAVCLWVWRPVPPWQAACGPRKPDVETRCVPRHRMDSSPQLYEHVGRVANQARTLLASQIARLDVSIRDRHWPAGVSDPQARAHSGKLRVWPETLIASPLASPTSAAPHGQNVHLTSLTELPSTTVYWHPVCRTKLDVHHPTRTRAATT